MIRQFLFLFLFFIAATATASPTASPTMACEVVVANCNRDDATGVLDTTCYDAVEACFVAANCTGS
jgi:hypothetical protein